MREKLPKFSQKSTGSTNSGVWYGFSQRRRRGRFVDLVCGEGDWKWLMLLGLLDVDRVGLFGLEWWMALDREGDPRLGRVEGGWLRDLRGYDFGGSAGACSCSMFVRCREILASYCIFIRLQTPTFYPMTLFLRPRRKAWCYGTSDVLQTPPRDSYEVVFTPFIPFSRLSAHNRVIRSLCSNTRF